MVIQSQFFIEWSTQVKSYIPSSILIWSELTVLDADYYANRIELELKFLDSISCFVPAITQDNEASPKAGVKQLIATSRAYLIPIACGPHTLELMMSNLSEAFPLLSTIIKDSDALTKEIKGEKRLLKEYFERQKFYNRNVDNFKPYCLFYSSNTRKWSYAYLNVSRLLKVNEFHLYFLSSILCAFSCFHSSRSRQQFNQWWTTIIWVRVLITRTWSLPKRCFSSFIWEYKFFKEIHLILSICLIFGMRCTRRLRGRSQYALLFVIHSFAHPIGVEERWWWWKEIRQVVIEWFKSSQWEDFLIWNPSSRYQW